MKKFEYKPVVFSGTFDIEEEFNKLGGEGWEFALLMNMGTTLGGAQTVFIFKRQKNEGIEVTN